MFGRLLISTLTGLTVLPIAAYALSSPERIVGVDNKVYKLPQAEADALEFLYRSMPMSDELMYSPEFHLRNIRLALQAREEMPWGKNVPDNIWKHFVLPSRANNEYLDSFRTTYYDELKDRVKGMNMYDAALEVNHWLHEKATYEPSDSRTSAPCATILTSKGRCGEESVLGVAAFRTVGIPARQVYTPRWAHTDDNHAWVEVWVDGKWYFLGACEPEPELNRAWFNAPASRGMLMHTRVFGDYNGPEQRISQSKGITEINVTENYVPIRDSKVTVYDRNGKPCKDIEVEYKIYNYAEFYTAAKCITDAAGSTMLKTGTGDMLAWASDGDYFGFVKIDKPDSKLILNHKIGEPFELDIDIVPPVENPIPSKATKEDIEENARRFEFENMLRNAYTDTFYGESNCTLTPEDVQQRFGNHAGLIDKYLRKARGNWKSVYDFVNIVPEEKMEYALAMLGAVSDKDLRDTPTRIFLASLTNLVPGRESDALYVDYVLNPRISNELLSDYRQSMYSAGKVEDMIVENIIKDASSIKIDNEANAYRVPVTPAEVWKSRRADSHSRDIYFVALCRNNHIPARIDQVTGSCQYHDGNAWVTVDFAADSSKDATTAVVPEGTFSATFTPEGFLTDPEYYRHFTISNMDNGTPRLYEFGDDIGETYSTLLKDGITLPAGYYLMTTGIRQASGAVSAHLSFFNVEADKNTETQMVMRHAPEAIEVIGNIDAEKLYLPENATAEQSILTTTGRGYFILGIIGATDEPSNHAVTELASIKKVLEDWGRPVVLLGNKRKELADFEMISWGSDPDNKVRDMLELLIPGDTDNTRLPIIVVADSFGRVVFLTTGYDTSLAQKLSQILPQL